MDEPGVGKMVGEKMGNGGDGCGNRGIHVVSGVESIGGTDGGNGASDFDCLGLGKAGLCGMDFDTDGRGDADI